MNPKNSMIWKQGGLVVLLVLVTTPALMAQGTSPWLHAVDVLQQAFTGPIARGLSLIAIVVGGLMFAFGEGGSKRALAGIVFGLGMAMGGKYSVNPSLRGQHQILLDTVISVVYISGHGSCSRPSGASRRESGVLAPGVNSRGSDPGGQGRVHPAALGGGVLEGPAWRGGGERKAVEVRELESAGSSSRVGESALGAQE